ncbi:MAG TPA: M13 family metallopeptidase [Myxococcota bacterium]
MPAAMNLRRRATSSLSLAVLTFTAAALTGTACSQAKPVETAPAATEPAPAAPSPAVSTAALPAGLDDAAVDRAVNPCDDFYQYACGTWMKTAQIPDDRSSTSRGFIAILERNEAIMKDILERAAAGKIAGDDGKKLGDHWSTCMDEPKLEASLAVLQKDAKAFANITDGKKLAAAVAKLHLVNGNALFSQGSMQDLKNSQQVVFGIFEGGLGLPDRDYYLVDDDKTKKVRDAYSAHVEKMLTLAGDTPAVAAQKRDLIMALEKRLATTTRTKVEKRDVEKMFHRLERDGTKKLAPSFDWDGYFKAIGLPKVTEINVAHPPFVEALEGVVKETTPATWAAYLQWVQLRNSVPALPKAMQEERFAYESKALTGAAADRPRWKKCVDLADGQLGEVLGRVFVAEQFGADGKARTQAMVDAVRTAFAKNIDTLSWMDEPTKMEAHAKADKMATKIGYPDVWRDYSKLKTTRTTFLDNYLAGVSFEVRRDLDKIGKPLDKNEWQMSPPTVNAYNDGQRNEIVFPAGILQPPFFNKEAPDAVNYGAMGMVVGHEITHGFDDEGKSLDAEGNLRDWWSPESKTAFEKKTACVKDQFDNSIALEDIKVNGSLTLGENVADLGGLKISFAAMQAAQAAGTLQPSSSPYSNEQLFFLGYAQSWCSKYRPENARLRAATDPHAPPFLRVNNPLANLPSFAKAFGCAAPSKMVRSAGCEVW